MSILTSIGSLLGRESLDSQGVEAGDIHCQSAALPRNRRVMLVAGIHDCAEFPRSFVITRYWCVHCRRLEYVVSRFYVAVSVVKCKV